MFIAIGILLAMLMMIIYGAAQVSIASEYNFGNTGFRSLDKNSLKNMYFDYDDLSDIDDFDDDYDYMDESFDELYDELFDENDF